MIPAATHQQVARRFLDVIPPVLHALGGEMRNLSTAAGPVTMAQFRTMAMLHRGPRSLNALATLYEVSAPTMSRLISTLVARAWVVRETDPNDRRQVVLRLSPEGETIWAALAAHSVAYLAEMLEEMTETEVSALESALAGLARAVAARRQGLECEQ